MNMMGTGWALVGRQEELRRVSQTLADPKVSGVVLAGPAGVGKTRLAQECLSLAERAGFATARVSATVEGAKIPFGALAALLPAGDVPASSRGEFVRAAAQAIAAKGEGRPIVVMIDDAHHLDDASATLVHQLAFSGQAFVAVTVRTEFAVPELITDLWKDGIAERIDVHPLAPDAVPQMIDAVLGGPAHPDLTAHLIRAAGGNPLVLHELLLGGIEDATLVRDGGKWQLRGRLPLSPRLIDIVESRLSGLSDIERSALEVLAVGAPLGAGVAERLADLEILASLEERDFLRTHVDGRRLVLVLSHPIHGEVLRAAMPRTRTRAVYRALAEAVEHFGARRRQDQLRVATWRLEAQDSAHPDAMLAGAHQAFALHDNALAARLAGFVFDHGGGFDAGLLYGQALAAVGENQTAENIFASLHPDSDEDKAALAINRGGNLGMGLERYRDAVALYVEAEAGIDDPDIRDGVALARAGQLVVLGEGSALALVEEILGRAKGQALVVAFIMGATEYVQAGRYAETLAIVERGLGALDAVPEPTPFTRRHNFLPSRYLALTGLGRLADAQAEIDTAHREATASGAEDAAGWVAFSGAACSLLQGRIKQALDWAGEAAALLSGSGYAKSAKVLLALTLAMAGKGDEANDVLAEVAAQAGTYHEVVLLRARAWTAAAAGDTNGASDLLATMAERAAAVNLLVHQATALHDRVRLGHTDGADQLAELAERIEGPLIRVQAAHAAALKERDGPGLDEASAAFESIGASLLAAETAAHAARIWSSAGQQGRASAARKRSTALLESCDGARAPWLVSESAEFVLSPREREVARLAVSGLGNREIAERLGVSKRTIDNQLQRVYEKLEVTGRAQLAAVLGVETPEP